MTAHRLCPTRDVEWGTWARFPPLLSRVSASDNPDVDWYVFYWTKLADGNRRGSIRIERKIQASNTRERESEEKERQNMAARKPDYQGKYHQVTLKPLRIICWIERGIKICGEFVRRTFYIWICLYTFRACVHQVDLSVCAQFYI